MNTNPKSKFSAAHVTTSADRSAHSFLLTGKPGIGKTWFLSTIPRCFVITTEEGLKGASPDHAVAHFDVPTQSVQDVVDACDAFIELNAPGPDGKRPYQHLGIDGMSGIEQFVHQEACKREGVTHMEGKDYGKVFSAAMPLYLQVQKKLDQIRRMGVHVWIVAHAGEATEAGEDGSMFRRWDLAFRGPREKQSEVRNLWRQWADHVLFLDWDVSVVSAKGKRTVGKLRSRVLRTQESGFAFAKSRARLPATLAATYEDLHRALVAGAAAPEAKLRKQIEAALGLLTDPENVAAIRADYAAAKGPNRLAAVLSRAQGMLSVERADEVDVVNEASPVQPAVQVDLGAPGEVRVDEDGVVIEDAQPAVEASFEARPQPAVEASFDAPAPVVTPSAVQEAASAAMDSMDKEVADALIERIADATDEATLLEIVGDIRKANLPSDALGIVRKHWSDKQAKLRGAQ